MFVGKGWVNEAKEGELHVQLLDIGESSYYQSRVEGSNVMRRSIHGPMDSQTLRRCTFNGRTYQGRTLYIDARRRVYCESDGRSVRLSSLVHYSSKTLKPTLSTLS